MEERQRFNDQMQKLLIRQQNHTTDLFEQQQQISNAFLNFMNKFASSSQCCYFLARKYFLKPHIHLFTQTLSDVVVLKSHTTLNKKEKSKIDLQGRDYGALKVH